MSEFYWYWNNISHTCDFWIYWYDPWWPDIRTKRQILERDFELVHEDQSGDDPFTAELQFDGELKVTRNNTYSVWRRRDSSYRIRNSR